MHMRVHVIEGGVRRGEETAGGESANPSIIDGSFSDLSRK